MERLWVFLGRALLLRCPRCGKGKLFRRWFTMYTQCPVCHFVYEREEGYFSGAMALNLVVSELIVTAFIFPVAVWSGTHPGVPFLPILLLGAPLPILFPFLFYRHSRGLWLNMNYCFDPPQPEGWQPPESILWRTDNIQERDDLS